MQISPEKATQIRDQLKKEQESWHHTQRYGLFSYLPDHGFGFRDDQTKPGTRDQTGKVKVAPRNFNAGRTKKSHSAKDAFTQCGYLSQHDEYINPSQTMRYREQNASRAKEVHGTAFRPSGANSKKIRAPYEYIADPGQTTYASTQSFRAPLHAAGSPKSFVTAPLKSGKGNNTVGHLFSTYDHHTDPYDNPNQMDSLERRDHAGRILNGAFQTTFKKRDHFTPNMHVYRNPSGMNGSDSTKNANFSKSASGFRPFLNSNPSKKGYNCTINRFPEYQEEGVQYPENNRLMSATASPKLWRHTYREKSVPSISVQHYNAVNRPRHKF